MLDDIGGNEKSAGAPEDPSWIMHPNYACQPEAGDHSEAGTHNLDGRHQRERE